MASAAPDPPPPPKKHPAPPPPVNLDCSSDSDIEEVPEHLRVTDAELAGSIPGSFEATAAALATHRRAESAYDPSLAFRRTRHRHRSRPTDPKLTRYGDLIRLTTPHSSPVTRQPQPTPQYLPRVGYSHVHMPQTVILPQGIGNPHPLQMIFRHNGVFVIPSRPPTAGHYQPHCQYCHHVPCQCQQLPPH